MTDRSVEVQRVVFEHLKAALRPTPVFDHPPQDQKFPFVDIVSHQVIRADAYASELAEHVIILAVWSRHRGQKEVLEILARIHNAVHRARLQLSSGDFVTAQVSDRSSQLDADGVTHQGSATLKILAQ